MAQVGIADPCVCGNRDAAKYRLYETKSGQILGKQCIPCTREWLIPEYQTPDEPDGYYAASDETAFDLSQISQQVPASGNEENSSQTSDSGSEGSDSGREESEPPLSLRKPFELDDNTAGQIIGSRTKIDWNFEQLIPGNHITWQRTLGYYHHAIVVDINDYGMHIIHWTKPTAGQIQIAKEFLALDKIMEENPDSLYRLDYPHEVEKTNDITLVLARAFSRNGDKKYGLLKDNCESFATFCKTGYEKSHQVVWLESKMKEFLGELGLTIVRTLVKTGSAVLANKALLKHTAAIVSDAVRKAGHEIAESAVQEFAQILADATAKVKGKLSEEAIRNLWQNFAAKASGSVNKVATEIAEQAVENMAKGTTGGKVFLAESAETIGKASNVIGAGLVILLEGIFYIKDVSKLHSEYAEGNQSRRVFIEDTTRRSVEGVSAASLTIAFSLGPEAGCAVIGTSMGPVGTLVGAVIGGAIGCAVGKAVGTSAGSRLGRKVAKGFQNDQAVESIHDLNPGDHVVLNCGGLKHPRCHAIIIKHDGKGNIKVIRNRYKQGVVEEWLEFKKPVFKVMYERDECKDSQKVILYARLKQHEGYRYSLARYNCKTFARECKTKSVLI